MGQFTIINLTQGFEDKHVEFLNNNSNYIFDLYSNTEIKHSNDIDDLFIKLSKEYKNTHFVVTYNGEYFEDYWTYCYYNGQYIYEQVDVIYPNIDGMIKQITNK